MKKMITGKAGFSPGFFSGEKKAAAKGQVSPGFLPSGKKAVGCIIQARMGSTRLPGKALKELNGMPVLQIVAERIGKCKRIDEIAVATSTNSKDDAIEEFCREHGVRCFRGSEENVLERFFGCAKKFGFETIVRITADCPLIDPATVDAVIEKFGKSKVDYASNVIERSFPRGLDAEVFSFEALSKANSEAVEQADREHVTHYIYSHPEKFRLLNVEAEGALFRPELRLCIDTEKDFFIMHEIFSHFKSPLAEAKKAIAFLRNNPELLALSTEEEQGYRQKTKNIRQGFLRRAGKEGCAIKQNFAARGTEISVRPVQYGDRRWILGLVNQRSVRKNSFSQRPILEADNDKYWKKKLASPDFKAFAGFVEKEPACLARIDNGIVSIAVDEKFRQQGIAFNALNSLGSGLQGCTAEIKPGNRASLKLFKKLGFAEKERCAKRIVMEKP